MSRKWNPTNTNERTIRTEIEKQEIANLLKVR